MKIKQIKSSEKPEDQQLLKVCFILKELSFFLFSNKIVFFLDWFDLYQCVLDTWTYLRLRRDAHNIGEFFETYARQTM